MNYPITDNVHNNRNASIEHIKPLSRGGKNHYANMVAACQGCNSMRSSDIDAMEFYRWRVKQTEMTVKAIRKALGEYRKARRLRAGEPATDYRHRSDAGLTHNIETSASHTTASSGTGWLRCDLRALLNTLKGWELVFHIVGVQIVDAVYLAFQISRYLPVAWSAILDWTRRFLLDQTVDEFPKAH